MESGGWHAPESATGVGQWPAVQQLCRKLPPGFTAEPRGHLGSQAEVDVAFEKDAAAGNRTTGGDAGVATADQMAVDGGDWFDNYLLVWPTAEIVEQNLHVRAEGARGTFHRDFRDLLFFAGAGVDGILFAFPVGGDRRCGSNVLTWHPVENELAEAAPTLEDFLRGWLRGEIAV